MASSCTWDGCEAKRWAKGYCSKHYYSAQRSGLLPRPACSVDDCEEPSFRKGMCNKHHLRAERHGDPLFRKKRANGEAKGSPCSIDGCDKPQTAPGLCSVHYARQRYRGDANAERKKLANGTATPERKRENRARAMRSYFQTPHGKLRSRFNAAKRRVLEGGCSEHIDKAGFLALWNTHRCGLCGGMVFDEQKSLDHIVPLSRGGDNTIANLQIAHLGCNQRKSNRPMMEAA